MSLNKVMLIGNLGQEPLIRYFDQQKVVATFTLATNESYYNKNGERRTETEWHSIEMWDQLAKTADDLKLKGVLVKGTLVYVEGRIRSESYRDKEGIERVTKKIRANQFSILAHPEKHETQEVNQQSTVVLTKVDSIQSTLNQHDTKGNDDLPY